MGKMKALVKYARGPGNMKLMEVDEPQPREGYIIVNVEYAAICASDILIMHDKHPYEPPVVMGHEFAGVVAESKDGWKKGDRVTSQTTFSTCGKCLLCLSGKPQHCPEKRVIGIKANGAFAPKILVPVSGLHRLPDNISTLEASITEIGADVLYALNERANLQPGEFVAVFGPGAAGLFAVQIAKATGAEVAVVGTKSERDEYRLSLAEKFGADHILYADEDPVKEIKRLTHGLGADVVFDATGHPSGVLSALRAVRNLGRVIAFGIPKTDVTIPWGEFVFKAIHVIFHLSSSWTSWEKILKLMRDGKVRTKEMISKVYPLEEWEKAFDEAAHGKVVRVVLKP